MIIDFDPVAFSVFGLEIRWYGINYVFGYFLAEYLGWFLLKNKNIISRKNWENFVFGTFLWGIIGGRLGEFLFYNISIFWENPLEILQIWKGGMSIHGGILGATIWIWYFSRKHKLNILQMIDAIVIPLTITLGLGRITNFINQEIIGIPTKSDFGVIFTNFDDILRHPVQIYESVLMFFLVIILWVFRKKNKGVLTSWFLILYGMFRFFAEFWKESDIIFLNLKMGQILCLVMIVVGMYSAWLVFRRKTPPIY